MIKAEYLAMGNAAYMVSEMIDRHLIGTYRDKELNEKCDRAMRIIREVYIAAISKST